MDNNVQGRIDDYLDQVFGPYEDSPRVSELRIEVRHDLLERLNDLTEHGVADEVAYAQVISSMGDIGSTIKELTRDYGDNKFTRAPDQGGGSSDVELTRDYGDSKFTHAPEHAMEEDTVAGEKPVPEARDNSTSEPTSPTKESTPEPEGPADQIPDGEAPGEEWTAPPYWSGPYSDLASDVADAVSVGLDTARTQLNWALKQAEEALKRAGRWNDRTRERWDRANERANERMQRATDRANRRMSFAASDLRNSDFHGQDLPGSSFTASDMRNSDFSSARLAGSSFRASDLRNARFDQADLTDANLNSCSLRNGQFERTNLTGASLAYSDMRNACFVGAALRGTRATWADLRNTRFNDCVIEGADFSGSDLRAACFDGLSLVDVVFNLANLADASFRGSTLHRVSFHHVSRKSVTLIVFDDTIMDRATYMSLRSSGYEPQGVRVED